MSSYLGNLPSNNFVSLKRQVISGNGGSTYTLDHSVASVNDVAIFVNNVRQDPASYSISTTSLTLGGTISSSDSCYVLFLGQALQTVTPDANTITNAMLTSGTFSNITGTGTLTNFSSTGIDDNASANALTIDSSSNLQFNSGYGSVATAFGVRVWLRYDGVNNTIEASGNVSSVTDNGTGDYTINYANNLPDADCAVGAWSGRNANPTITGQANAHSVSGITIASGDSINSAWTPGDVDDVTIIIVK
jgi:hypothetical protein